MTARQLAARLAAAGVTATYADDKLVLSAPPPPALAPAARVLKTGLASIASGRVWYGCDGATGRSEALSVDARIPAGVTLLTVAGAAKWDRVPPAARLDLPDLFDAGQSAADRKTKPRPRVAA